MHKSIRYRLLVWFISFVFLMAGLIIPVNMFYNAGEQKAMQASVTIQILQIDFLKDIKAVNDHFASLQQKNESSKNGSFPVLTLEDRNYIQTLLVPVLKARQPELVSSLENISAEMNEYYSDLENALVFLNSGLYENQSARSIALQTTLNDKAGRIIQDLDRIALQAGFIQKSLTGRLTALYSVSIALILLMAVVFSYKASKHIVSPLKALARYISKLSKSRLDDSQTIEIQNSAQEIREIYREFSNLISQLSIWEKQRDSALQNAHDNQQKYRELADMLPQSVFETDSFGNYTYVNKAWYQAFGFESGDLKEGLNLIETLISEAKESDILGIEKIENSNFMAVRKDGTRFPASVYTDNIIRNGKIAGRRGIVIDITERANYIRALQQETTRAKTSDELKSSFLANMSHEIRTPMNSIIGFSNLLASDQVPETQKKNFTQYIRTSSEILLNLVDDIIDIAKIEAGELKIVKKDCELNALGNELLTTSLETRNRFNKQNIHLGFKPDHENAEIYIKTDPFRLRQVLVNLINNAIKFTDKGSVEFGYNVTDDSTIEFYVKDTGPGLSRDELDMIFERFKRSKRSEDKNIVGTGLGLAIAKNLVQLLGGEMWVDSATGVGTTFLFTLPYLRSTIIPERDKNYQSHTEYNWKGKTILIVEDDINSYKYLNELLRRTQASILHASNGNKAVDIVKAEHIDAVIMDIQLPVMDGIEATKIIKSLQPELPVIAQTAFAMAGDREKMKQAGCDDYVSKPLNSGQILASLHHFLSGAARKSHSRQNSPRIITG